jgi:hypothetical protein
MQEVHGLKGQAHKGHLSFRACPLFTSRDTKEKYCFSSPEIPFLQAATLLRAIFQYIFNKTFLTHNCSNENSCVFVGEKKNQMFINFIYLFLSVYQINIKELHNFNMYDILKTSLISVNRCLP